MSWLKKKKANIQNDHATQREAAQVDDLQKAQGALASIDLEIRKLEGEIKRCETKIDSLKAEAKEYVQKGNNKMAAMKLKQVADTEKQIGLVTNNMQLLSKNRNAIESKVHYQSQLEVLKKTNVAMKSTEKVTEEFMDAMQENEEMQQMINQANEMIEMAAGPVEEDDDIMDQLKAMQAEVAMEKVNGVSVPTGPVKQAEKPAVKEAHSTENILDGLL